MEKLSIQSERDLLLKERSAVDEKEGRVGLLMNNLDEKDSKLRQLLGTMKDQQEQWQRSISDLQRREDLVDEWQRSHKQRERKLQEIDLLHEKTFAELSQREAAVSVEEQKLRITTRELTEREQRLQVGLSRVANTEQSLASMEEKLSTWEDTLKKRELDSDMRERELLSRRKEMESWDSLLREKDKKIAIEQRVQDEREVAILTSEEKARTRESDLEKRLAEVKKSEVYLSDQLEVYQKLIHEAKNREIESRDNLRKSLKLKEELSEKESDLAVWESSLLKMRESMVDLEEKEADLTSRVAAHKKVEEDFYNVTVSQITSRHLAEVSKLETIVNDQLKVVIDFQSELEATRSELSSKSTAVKEYEVMFDTSIPSDRYLSMQEMVVQRNCLIDDLTNQLRKLEEETSKREQTRISFAMDDPKVCFLLSSQ